MYSLFWLISGLVGMIIIIATRPKSAFIYMKNNVLIFIGLVLLSMLCGLLSLVGGILYGITWKEFK